MSTRATIRFKEGDEEYFIYRHHDGFPENIGQDIKEVLELIKGRWSEPELGNLISFFLGRHFDINQRVPSYELTPCFHGDESYLYYVEWDAENKTWNYYYE